MKISYNWLCTYFKKPLFGSSLPKPALLAEIFNTHFAEIESMERVGGDTIFDLKTLADRNHYALSHIGVAVEAGVLTGRKVELGESAQVPIDASVPKQEVEVREQKLCRRYIARAIRGVRVGPSPAWLRTRLESIGARSINSVVDATNYVMFDLGQPLHAFDADKVEGTIIVRLAKAGEKMTLLDGREVELRESDLLIADEAGPLVIAGVKGGKRAEVTETTKNIILESASFDPTAVRRTATRLSIRNDSSKRFENDLTPHIALRAMDTVTALILATSGGQAGAVNDIYPEPVKPWTVEADPAQINAITGLSLSAEDMKAILERLWCKVEIREGKLFVIPPFVRQDLAIPEDLADEIGRITGYDKLASKQTPAVPPTPIDKTFYWAEKTKNLLVKLGFSETYLYTLVSKGAFEISYPLASDKSALREKIAPKLAESLAMNARNADLLGLETVKIFEIGKVFPKTGEKTSICIGVSQVKKKKGITSESLLKEVVATLETKLGIHLSADGASKIETGPYGALIEADFDAAILSQASCGLLEGLQFKALPKDTKYIPFSHYPFITRDIAVFTPSGTLEAQVLKVLGNTAISSAGPILVKGPDLFDTFEKDGKTSFAFRMIFQSFEKTLSDDEANAIMAKVYDAVKGKGWEVR